MSWIELVAQRLPKQIPQGVTPPENAADWFRVQASAENADETDVYVYDSIGGWFGMYADEFVAAMRDITSPRINLRLNSPGGSVFEGITIANAIRSHPANVTVYVDGLAASIASVIALAGDKLVMLPQSQLMIHDASGGCHGNAADMEYMVGLLNKQSDNIADAYADRAGGTAAEWRNLMKAETWYTAKEAVAAGLADEVMAIPQKQEADDTPIGPEDTIRPLATMMNQVWDLTAYKFSGREKAPDPAKPVALKPGDKITAEAVNAIQAQKPAEIIVKIDGEELGATLGDYIRKAIRAEIAVLEAAVSPSHSTSVESGTWDAGANEKRLPSPIPVATVKKMYTYYDADEVEDGAAPKSACKLPHHFVSEDGTPGAASVNGVRNALARLPQTQGLSDAERSAAEAHLRKHLNAFDGDEEDSADLEDVQDESGETSSPAVETPPEVKAETPPSPEATAEPDEWSALAAHLIESPLPSADDVFNRLKEAI